MWLSKYSSRMIWEIYFYLLFTSNRNCWTVFELTAWRISFFRGSWAVIRRGSCSFLEGESVLGAGRPSLDGSGPAAISGTHSPKSERVIDNFDRSAKTGVTSNGVFSIFRNYSKDCSNCSTRNEPGSWSRRNGWNTWNCGSRKFIRFPPGLIDWLIDWHGAIAREGRSTGDIRRWRRRMGRALFPMEAHLQHLINHSRWQVCFVIRNLGPFAF